MTKPNASAVLSSEYPDREIGRRVLFVASCGSTNDLLADPGGGYVHGDVLWAGEQTAGRGRYGRSWVSPAGALPFSILLTTREAQPQKLPLLFALGLVRWLEMKKLAAAIKWPNDVYLDGKKLCGILTESRMENGAWRLIVGVGLNVAVAFPPELAGTAISLREAGLELDPAAALAELLPHLDAVWREYHQRGWTALRDQIEFRLLWRGEAVTVREGDRTLGGTLRGLDADGNLFLDETVVRAGELVRVSSG